MFDPIDTRVPATVQEAVTRLYHETFPSGSRDFVSTAFAWGEQCFTGRFADYQGIDARYHDFEHTLQGTLCLVRLLAGRHRASARPIVDERRFQLALLAILFHDTGYLKRRDDAEGTGAKYTLVHVARSAQFASDFLSVHDYAFSDILAVQNMICCTGVNADLDRIPFQSELERTLGFALATADLLGQMAAPDYVDKLPILFAEFVEAARYAGEKAGRFRQYATADELMRHTPEFWQSYVWPKINRDFLGLYAFLNDPWPEGPNPYLQRIEQNLARLRQRASASTP